LRTDESLFKPNMILDAVYNAPTVGDRVLVD